MTRQEFLNMRERAYSVAKDLEDSGLFPRIESDTVYSVLDVIDRKGAELGYLDPLTNEIIPVDGECPF
jgi:hypothetical protein